MRSARGFSSDGAEVTLRIPCAGPRNVSLLTAFPAAPTAVWPPAVSLHVAKAKAAVTSLDLRLSADPAGDPLDLDAGRLQ